MPHLEPFRGLRYHPALVPDLAEVTSPPYDQIGPSERRALLARHRRNVVRLILGDPWDMASPAGYADAARTLRDWLAGGFLVREHVPAIYGYSQRFRDPLIHPARVMRERLGIIALIRLAPWGDGIHPHERTLSGPKGDRLRLLRAARAHLDPLFGLFSDPEGSLMRAVLETRGGGLEEREFTDEARVRHRLWPIVDPAVIAHLVAGIAGRDIVIADGHHRYEAALAFRDECRAAGAPLGHADRLPMFLTAIEHPGLVILPYHRLLRGIDPEELRPRLDEKFSVEPMDGAGGIALRHRLGPQAIGFLTPRRALRLVPRGPANEHPAAVLDREILGGILGWEADGAVSRGDLSFLDDWRRVAREVEGGDASFALLLPPTPVSEVVATALGRRTLPQKSTSFYPKIPAGLVFDLIDS
jgi:uncharacterized protein (DUF1015 family)